MKLRMGLVLLLSLMLVACSNPLPEDKLMYVGEWSSKEIELLILADGTVAYSRVKNGGVTSINASIQEFHGDDFIVGVGPFKTTFEVSVPPQKVGDEWQMVVDGVRLTRVSD